MRILRRSLPFRYRQTSRCLRLQPSRARGHRRTANATVNHITRAESLQAIRRGWSKHCPHCGTGELFIGWNKPHRNCPACGYLYERDYGDVWWVWIVTDRIPVGIGIVLLYFGFRVRSFWMGVLFFGSLSLPLLLTIPRRYGLAIAITYLIRKRWRTEGYLSDIRLAAMCCPTCGSFSTSYR